MKMKHALYVCVPCRAQKFHDVPARGMGPTLACEKCCQSMTRTTPNIAQALFKKADAEARDQAGR